MTEEEQGVLDERVALEVMGFKESYVNGEAWGSRIDCYGLGDTQIRQDGWKPTRNEEQFRMAKDRLKELGLTYTEYLLTIGDEILFYYDSFCIYRQGVRIATQTNIQNPSESTIQELGCLAAVEAVERTKKACQAGDSGEKTNKAKQ